MNVKNLLVRLRTFQPFLTYMNKSSELILHLMFICLCINLNLWYLIKSLLINPYFYLFQNFYFSISSCSTGLMAPIMNFDWDGQMFQAISSNNLCTVHRLISSGISVNLVLHHPDRSDCTTILAEAAYAGSLDIVDYLVKAGALINNKDPSFGRTPLHRACMGQRTEVAIFLIKNRADVNCVDCYNMTPIIFAAMKGCLEIVTCLIQNGANPHRVNRWRFSALHYATFYGYSEVVSRLIKAGCIPNVRFITGDRTPLENLMHNEDYTNCHLLLDSGYDLRNEDYLHKYAETFFPSLLHSDTSNSNFTDCISQMDKLVLRLRTPQSLKSFCRIVIRKSMQGSYLQERVNTLPLPAKIKNYLLFV